MAVYYVIEERIYSKGEQSSSFCMFNMKKYPILRRPTGQHNNSIVPVTKPNIQIPSALSVLSQGPGHPNRNIAGQVYTRIDLRDKNGNRMTIHQRQQVLNLVNNTKNFFHVSDDSDNHRHSFRRNRYVKR